MRPNGNAGRQTSAAIGIGVHIGRQWQTFSADFLNFGDGRLHLRPVLPTGGLEMINLASRAALTHDVNHLVQSLKKLRAFTAKMRDVHPIILGDNAAQFDKLFCGLIGRRRINQSGRHAHGALLHGLMQQTFHRRHLACCDWTVIIAGRVDSQSGGADERGDIGGDTLALQKFQVFAQSRPFNVIVDIGNGQDGIARPFHFVIERAHRSAFAHDFKGHALLDVADAAPVRNQRFSRPTKHIDEPRRHGQAVQVDDLRRAGLAETADVRDFIAVNGQVAAQRLGAAAVVNCAIA